MVVGVLDALDVGDAIALLATLVASIAAWFASRSDRRHNFTDSAIDLYDREHQRVEQLIAENRRLRRRLYRIGINPDDFIEDHHSDD